MISLGIAELVAAAGFIFTSVFGGEGGVSGDRMNGPELFGLSLGPIEEVYWFIAFWTLVGTVAMFAFSRTPLGKMGEAGRDNPERLMFVGYDPQRVRYLVFIASGGFAGLAGGMAAVNYEIFTPVSLSALSSGLVLLMAYIGGIRYFARTDPGRRDPHADAVEPVGRDRGVAALPRRPLHRHRDVRARRARRDRRGAVARRGAARRGGRGSRGGGGLRRPRRSPSQG